MTLIASDGWNPNGPTTIHSRASLISVPNRKVMTSSSAAARPHVYL